MKDLIESVGPVRDVLNIKLFAVGEQPFTLASLITALLVTVVAMLLATVIDKAIGRTLRHKLVAREGAFAVSRRLLRYAIYLAGVGIAMNTIGIDVSALFTAGAIFAVGIGFAMQNIAQNFVSGVILLLERTIKPGDILRVEDKMVRIEEMGIRSTIARTREDEEVIIPNSTLAQSTVTNYSLSDKLLRLRSFVGVTYSSDMRLVREVLEKVGAELTDERTGRPAAVILREFGDSSVVWEMSIWIERPWDEVMLKGRALEAIWFALKEAGIVIAFPQLDLHLDRDVFPPWEQRRPRQSVELELQGQESNAPPTEAELRSGAPRGSRESSGQ